MSTFDLQQWLMYKICVSKSLHQLCYLEIVLPVLNELGVLKAVCVFLKKLPILDRLETIHDKRVIVEAHEIHLPMNGPQKLEVPLVVQRVNRVAIDVFGAAAYGVAKVERLVRSTIERAFEPKIAAVLDLFVEAVEPERAHRQRVGLHVRNVVGIVAQRRHVDSSEELIGDRLAGVALGGGVGVDARHVGDEDANGGPTGTRTTSVDSDSELINQASVRTSVGAERAGGIEHEVDVRGVDRRGDVAGRIGEPRVLQKTRHAINLRLNKRQHVREPPRATVRFAARTRTGVGTHAERHQLALKRRVSRIAPQMRDIELALQQLRREAIFQHTLSTPHWIGTVQKLCGRRCGRR